MQWNIYSLRQLWIDTEHYIITQKHGINIPPCNTYCRTVVASDLLWRGSSIMSMMFLQVVGVGRLLSQLWSVFDSFIWSDKFVASKLSIVFSSTPSRSPISYHLEDIDDRYLSSTCFSGFESMTMLQVY